MDSFLHVRLCLSCRAYNLPTYFRISPQKLLQPLYYTTSPRRKQAEFSQNRFRQYAALHHTGSSHAENAGRISSILALPIPYRFAKRSQLFFHCTAYHVHRLHSLLLSDTKSAGCFQRQGKRDPIIRFANIQRQFIAIRHRVHIVQR